MLYLTCANGVGIWTKVESCRITLKSYATWALFSPCLNHCAMCLFSDKKFKMYIFIYIYQEESSRALPKIQLKSGNQPNPTLIQCLGRRFAAFSPQDLVAHAAIFFFQLRTPLTRCCRSISKEWSDGGKLYQINFEAGDWDSSSWGNGVATYLSSYHVFMIVYLSFNKPQ